MAASPECKPAPVGQVEITVGPENPAGALHSALIDNPSYGRALAEARLRRNPYAADSPITFSHGGYSWSETPVIRHGQIETVLSRTDDTGVTITARPAEGKVTITPSRQTEQDRVLMLFEKDHRRTAYGAEAGKIMHDMADSLTPKPKPIEPTV
jgi:hypothetical protein